MCWQCVRKIGLLFLELRFFKLSRGRAFRHAAFQLMSLETKLTTRDTNRVERPFDWGLDWMRGWPFVNGHQPHAAEIESYVHQLNERIVAESDTFFNYKVPTDFRLENRKVERFHTGSGPAPKDKKITHADFLRFTSPVKTPYPENDLANARWFPPNPKNLKAGSKKRAV